MRQSHPQNAGFKIQTIGFSTSSVLQINAPPVRSASQTHLFIASLTAASIAAGRNNLQDQRQQQLQQQQRKAQNIY